MKKSSIYVFLSAVFFATGGLFFKVIAWEALAISSARAILAECMILAFLLINKHKFIFNRNVIFAAVSLSATNTLFALSNKLTTAGNAIVLQFSMPVFVILISLSVFRKKPTKLEILTCIAVLGGIICFFIDSLSAGNMLGNMLSLLSGLTYAGFFIFNSRDDSEPFSAVVIAYAITALVGLPWLIETDFAATPTSEWLAVLALGFVQQGMSQICFAKGIKGTSVVAASLISGIEPVLNPILVAVFYHEHLTPLSIVGAVIVLISILSYNVIAAKK